MRYRDWLVIGLVQRRAIHSISLPSRRFGKSDSFVAVVVDGVIGCNRATSHFEWSEKRKNLLGRNRRGSRDPCRCLGLMKPLMHDA